MGWSEKRLRKYQNRTGIQTSQRILQDDKFPEQSRKGAEKRCRNPTGDPNGLWCFVAGTFEDQETFEKEYCDVDYCNPYSSMYEISSPKLFPLKSTYCSVLTIDFFSSFHTDY